MNNIKSNSQKIFYENFHKDSRSSHRVASKNDFTYWNIIRQIEQTISGKSHLKILDYGCGVGQVDLYFAKQGYSVVGVDISSNAIDKALSSKRLLGITDVKFTTIDNNVWQKTRYDLIICSEVLEHVPKYRQLINKLIKLVKNDGLLFITVPSRNTPLIKLKYLKQDDRKVGHLRRFDLKLMQSLVFPKFSVVEIKYFDGIIRTYLFTTKFGSYILKIINKLKIFNPFIMKLDNFLAQKFGGGQIVLIMKKHDHRF